MKDHITAQERLNDERHTTNLEIFVYFILLAFTITTYFYLTMGGV